MPHESQRVNVDVVPAQPPSARTKGGTEDLFDQLAAGLYSLASMLVGEGEESMRLVEMAIADAEVSVCCNFIEARKSSQRALAKAALAIIARREPGSLTAPDGFASASSCIEDDDLDAAGVSSEELERMIAGAERVRVRRWLTSLSIPLRVIFVMRAVASFTAAETAELLTAQQGSKAAEWTPDAVRVLFRQGLCSLASQLIHATAAK